MCLGPVVHGFKIIKGEKAPENSMQFMVSIQDEHGVHQCGGFLIREDFVVTAAHCSEEKIHQILLGSHDLKGSNRKIIPIGETYKPKTYMSVKYGDDIMLIKLSPKASLSNSIKTIPLPTSEMNLNKPQTCYVAGWGKTLSNQFGVNELRVVNVSIIDPEICQSEWHYELPSNVICAGGYNTNKGFCQGDSGGPLVCEGKAVGVVSFNRALNCNYPDVPNVYTNVFRYLPWIKEILKNN
ncbi:granzyme B [Austrofundulus limnaeus]|uniref:Granzyme B n=1 Tax=Austrofundulus limnaeus TaxID=52670 RepID=A0A2I4AWZ4_AUSLI|nr:PREDICTED: granzyme B-like [Austrofundulus limnaeus]